MRHPSPFSSADDTARLERGYDAFNYDAEERRSSFMALLSLLLERRWFIVSASVLGVAVAAAVLSVIPPRYVAQSVVVIGTRSPQVVDLQPVVSGLSLNPFAFQAQVETEMQIIKSRRTMEQMIERLGLAEDPEFNPRIAKRLSEAMPSWIPDSVRDALLDLRDRFRATEAARAEGDGMEQVWDTVSRRVTVQPMGRSTALAISVSSTDPDKAARIADTLAEIYVEASLQEKVAATERALGALRERLQELRTNVFAAEDAVERYRIEAGLVDQDGSAGSRRLAELRNQVTLAQAQSATANARLNELRNFSGDIASLADVLASPTIQRLRQQEVELERQTRETLSWVSDRHPDAIARRNAQNGVRARIRQEIDKIASSLEAEARVAAEREQVLRTNLASAEREVGALNQAGVKLRELEREAGASRNLYEVFLRRYQEVDQQLGLQQPDGQVISRAERPQRPSWPPKLLFLGLAGMLSALGSSFFLVLRELTRGGFRSSDDVRDAFQIPTVALVPRLTMFQRLRGGGGSSVVDTSLAFGESIQMIRVQVRRMLEARPGRVVLFTSAIGGEGKTSVATACARLAAQAGQKAIIVDCDFRRSRMGRIFGSQRFGLADVLDGHCELEEAIGSDPLSGVSYITSRRSAAASPADLLGSRAMQMLIRNLAQRYEIVVLDTPPVLAVADTLAVAPLADTTLFVVGAEQTPRHLVRSALYRLAQTGIEVSGIILSKARAPHTKQYCYGGHRAVATAWHRAG